MFDKLRRARSDLAMMNALLPIAEQLARRDSIDEPGAEHLLLAALGLDDGVARDSFESVGVDEERSATRSLGNTPTRSDPLE